MPEVLGEYHGIEFITHGDIPEQQTPGGLGCERLPCTEMNEQRDIAIDPARVDVPQMCRAEGGVVFVDEISAVLPRDSVGTSDPRFDLAFNEGFNAGQDEGREDGWQEGFSAGFDYMMKQVSE